MGPVEYPPGEAVGAPDHPHRGFETVTYALEGDWEHEDSAGHRGRIGPGDVQWMTAGGGVVHSEMPARRIREQGGRVHGFQIWVNLPRRDKMMAPRYQEIPSSRLPERTSADGLSRVRLLAGEALGGKAVIETRTPVLLHDWTLSPGARVEVPVPPRVPGLRLRLRWRGARRTRGPRGPRRTGSALRSGDEVTLAVPADARSPARLLLLGGVPLGEPVARYGPFRHEQRRGDPPGHRGLPGRSARAIDR
jgi:redox-sensitive bicupin YhaK (pirin superfamily)